MEGFAQRQSGREDTGMPSALHSPGRGPETVSDLGGLLPQLGTWTESEKAEMSGEASRSPAGKLECLSVVSRMALRQGL